MVNLKAKDLMKSNGEQRTGAGLSWLTLFVSTGTLLCCALPILLVSLGFGATVAAITSSIPALITLSQYKVWIFIVSGVLLAGSSWFIWRTSNKCPIDPVAANLCQHAQKWNRRIWFLAGTIWCIGFFASFIALPLRNWLEL